MKQKITLLLLLMTTIVSAQMVSIQGGSSYSTIQEAVDAASDGDVILITGIHTEAVSVNNKSITLRGNDPTTDIIQAANTASSDGSGNRPITFTATPANPGDFVPELNIAVENLGIRHGNVSGNGGGIFLDKITGLANLSNLIIEDNHAGMNGGAIGLAGTIATVTECTIQNNSSTLDGGAILAAPNNGSGKNSVIDIKQSLINNNTGRNGGGFFINGNNNFGNNFLIDVTIENSTVSNNNAFSPSGGNGGGAIFSASRPWTSDTSVGNITLTLIHSTFYGNTHNALGKSGIQFGSAKSTNFSAYNSIIVSTDDVSIKALNFANSNTTDVVNCILGGLNAAPGAIIDDSNKNNLKGRTATQAGLSGSLSDEGGATQVMTILDATSAVNFCTAAVTGVTLPTVDQRGATRTGTPDAGAFEFGATLSLNNNPLRAKLSVYPNPSSDLIYVKGLENVQSIKIYSILGSLIKTIENSNIIDVRGMSKGVHIAVIKNDEGSVSKRFIVE